MCGGGGGGRCPWDPRPGLAEGWAWCQEVHLPPGGIPRSRSRRHQPACPARGPWLRPRVQCKDRPILPPRRRGEASRPRGPLCIGGAWAETVWRGVGFWAVLRCPHPPEAWPRWLVPGGDLPGEQSPLPRPRRADHLPGPSRHGGHRLLSRRLPSWEEHGPGPSGSSGTTVGGGVTVRCGSWRPGSSRDRECEDSLPEPPPHARCGLRPSGVPSLPSGWTAASPSALRFGDIW